MSEKVYAWLLLLFPAGFRETYGRDALELFRDRWRHERGLFLRFRLWADLITDLMISIPREYRNGRSASKHESSRPNVGAWPGFHVLSVDRIRPTSLLLGSVITLVALDGLMVLSSDVIVHPSETPKVSFRASLDAGHEPTGIGGFSSVPELRHPPTPNVFSAGLLAFLTDDVSVMEASSNPFDARIFATVSITPSRSTDPRTERMRVLPNGDLIARAVSVLTLVSFAYDVPANPSPRLSGVPDWSLERYDIEAKAPANVIPPGPPRKEALHQAQQMIRGLLVEHFRLVIQVENKRMPVYSLTVGNKRPKLQKARVMDEPSIFDTDPEGCHSFVVGFGHPLRARAVDMDDLAHYIENWADLPVVNRTGLEGLFTLNTGGWAPMRLPPPPPGSTPNPSVFAGLPTVFTVLADLGLTLDKKDDATLPVYTVKHIERPASN